MFRKQTELVVLWWAQGDHQGGDCNSELSGCYQGCYGVRSGPRQAWIRAAHCVVDSHVEYVVIVHVC